MYLHMYIVAIIINKLNADTTRTLWIVEVLVLASKYYLHTYSITFLHATPYGKTFKISPYSTKQNNITFSPDI